MKNIFNSLNIFLVCSFFASSLFAQGTPSSTSTAISKSSETSTVTSETEMPSAKSSATWDRFQPGWNPNKMKKALAFSTNFLYSGNALVYDNFSDDQTSWAYYLGLSKSADTFTSTSSTTVSGTTTITTTTANSFSGVKNPYVLGLGTAYYKKIFRNEWIFIRGGVYGGVDYYMKSNYQSGSRTESVVSTAPTTTNVSESSYGDVSSERSMPIRFGPVIDTSVFLRWFPQIAVGFQAAMLYTTDNKLKSKTSLRTRTYSIINGVDQTPTADSLTEQTQESAAGPSISTFSVAGSTFNFMGTFTIKYMW